MSVRTELNIKTLKASATLVSVHISTNLYIIHSFFFFYKNIVFPGQAEVLIFPPILGSKYSCIILDNSL